MRPGLGRRLYVLAAIACTVALGACGIATGPPGAVPAGQIPAGLESRNPPVSSPSTPPGGVPFSVYLFNSGLVLTPYQRFVTVKSASLMSILQYLIAGPDLPEEAAGVSTSIPADTEVLSVSPPVNNVVTVDFNEALTRVTGASQVQAVEQVVFTIDHAPSIPPSTGVLFEIGGQAISVPKGSGNQTSAPVSTADYPVAAASLPPTAAPSQ